MTLIVGIKCTDGVVMGADGAATLGLPFGQDTVIQPVSKLHIVDGRMIMGVSGPVGLSHLYLDRVERLWRDRKIGRDLSTADCMRLLREAISQDASVAAETAREWVSLHRSSLEAVLTSSLIALPIGGISGRPELIQFDYMGMPESASEDLPWVAIGSGQQLADPFLAFLRRVFWKEKSPHWTDGAIATVWTLLHAIQVTPGGVSGPIQVAVLSRQKGNELSARMLSDNEIEECRQNVLEIETRLASHGFSPQASTISLPKPP